MLVRDARFLAPIVGNLYSFMVFSLTFYTGSILSRYWAQWDCTQAAWGRMDDIDSIGAAYLMHDVPAHNTIKRICHAFQIVKYLEGVAAISKKETLAICVQRQLLTAAEQKELLLQDNSTPRRLIIWAMQTIEATNIDTFKQRHLVELVSKLRIALDTLWSFDDTPIPFVYYHLMNLLTFVVLILRGFVDAIDETTNFRSSVSDDNDEFSSAGFLGTTFVTLFVSHLLFNWLVLALKELAIMISDPFVDGNNAIPIERYMDLSLSMHSKLTNYHHTRPSVSEDPGFGTSHRTINPLSKRVEVDLKRRELRLRTRWRPVFNQVRFEEKKKAAKIILKLNEASGHEGSNCGIGLAGTSSAELQQSVHAAPGAGALPRRFSTKARVMPKRLS